MSLIYKKIMLTTFFKLSLTQLMTCLKCIHAPYKNVKKHKFKFKEEPWISSTIQKSISTKNSISKKYINKKDPLLTKNYIKNIRIIQILSLH